jgi:hypothetical protein
MTLRSDGQSNEAEELFWRVMETFKRVLDKERPDTLASMHNLAFTWKGKSRDEEAVVLMSECV